MPSIRPLPGACGRSSATVWLWSPPADRRLMPTVAWEDSGRTATPMQRCSWIARCPSWMGMRRPPRSSLSPFWGVYAQTAENSITQIQVQQARTGNPLRAGFRMVAKAAGFSVQILARCAGRRAVCPSPVAKQVFPDTAGSAMNRTTASAPGDSEVVRERDGLFGGLGVHPLNGSSSLTRGMIVPISWHSSESAAKAYALLWMLSITMKARSVPHHTHGGWWRRRDC